MKKFSKVLVALIAAMMLLSLVACGPSGEYKLVSVSYGSTTISSESITGSVKINSDKTYTMTYTFSLLGSNISDTSVGTWEKVDGNIVFTNEDGTAVTATLEKGVLTISNGGTSMVFEKL
ncbi:MAG: hypothetical protein PHX51_03585 [Clostridia bacterium]|nr:hypothetical protein [Clostridia bacterium]